MPRPGQAGAADAQGVRSIRRALGHPVPAHRRDAGDLDPGHHRGDRAAQDDGAAPGAHAGTERAAVGHRRRVHGGSRPVALGLPGPAELAAAAGDPGDDAGPRRQAHRDGQPVRAARHLPGVRRPAGVAAAASARRRRRRRAAAVGGRLVQGPAAGRARRAAGPDRARLAPRRGAPGHAASLGRPQAAADGYAVSHGEREEGLSAVAVPVTGRSGGVVAALALSGPTLRFTAERVAEFAADLKAAGARMSERGFDHPLGPAT